MSARISSPDDKRTPQAAPSFTVMDFDLRIATHCAALIVDELDEALHELARAAHGEVDAVGLLQKGDEAVDGRGAEGIAPDQQGMKAEDRAQAFIAHEGV